MTNAKRDGEAICGVCEESHPIINSTGHIDHHYLPGAVKCEGSDKPPQEQQRLVDLVCAACNQLVRVTDNGTLRPHNARLGDGLLGLCGGSGVKVVPPSSMSDRPDDRSDSTSIRTVSGGLGGLGKRRS